LGTQQLTNTTLLPTMSALGSAGATVQTAVNDALVFLLTDTATWSWTQILSLYFVRFLQREFENFQFK
jgi:hypothetical protein